MMMLFNSLPPAAGADEYALLRLVRWHPHSQPTITNLTLPVRPQWTPSARTFGDIVEEIERRAGERARYEAPTNARPILPRSMGLARRSGGAAHNSKGAALERARAANRRRSLVMVERQSQPNVSRPTPSAQRRCRRSLRLSRRARWTDEGCWPTCFSHGPNPKSVFAVADSQLRPSAYSVDTVLGASDTFGAGVWEDGLSTRCSYVLPVVGLIPRLLTSSSLLVPLQYSNRHLVGGWRASSGSVSSLRRYGRVVSAARHPSHSSFAPSDSLPLPTKVFAAVACAFHCAAGSTCRLPATGMASFCRRSPTTDQVGCLP
ncbi:hypothetical protein HMN09_01139600 [Mycena chlorophos]|uniref:Uncharacterized protein n=1 Tax=Mycena chlorophos TaxID=658473 RepID=A0A8H6S877_MYCCL|nr:hypothetical protein HMN09_01139600 [Mycena chlorophos]